MNSATARFTAPTAPTAPATIYVGDVVWASDNLSYKGNRPMLVVTMDGEKLGVCPISSTPQGRLEITELRGSARPSYVAAVDRVTRRSNMIWVEASAVALYKKQLTRATVLSALAEVTRQFKSTAR